MQNLVYEFARTDGGEEQGFNDPVINHFLGNVSYHLARESIQNITDAAEKYPVKAKFEVLDVRSHELPNYQELLNYIVLASQYEPNKGNDRAKRFYSHAYDILSNNQYIRIMKIADYNTRGMIGEENDRNGDYFKFFKSVGVSGKAKGRGGSWGLGKGSYFAASHLRTVFVTSVYDDNKYMFGGKLRLNSFIKDGIPYQGNGWYGLEGKLAVRDKKKIPAMFNREEQGTTFFVVAFNEFDSWKEEMIRSVLNNFWPAIADGNLEVTVDTETIDSGTLELFIKDRYLKDEPHTKSEPNPYPFYLAYKNGLETEMDNEILGKVKLYSINGDHYNNQVAYSRQTGMVIQFNQRFGPKKHMSIIYCVGDEGNELLRNMENPQHNKWDPENIDDMDQELKERAKIAIRDIDEFIRKTLRDLAGDSKAEVLEIKGLEELGLKLNLLDEDSMLPSEMYGELTADSSVYETGTEIGATDSDNVSVSRLLKPIRIPVEKVNIKEGEEEYVTGEGVGGEGERIGGKTADEDEIGFPTKILLPIKYRSYATTQDQEILHTVIIKDLDGKRVDLSFFAVTDSGLIALSIEHAKSSQSKKLILDNNKILGLEFKQTSGSQAVEAKFEEKGKFGLFIKAYENR